ncbi:MAG: zf-HC2 domain-containing protein [Acidobacteriota bacterium]|nr:zf-HC2 domain-containing protein [Acidobacteriota bacterium]
MFSKHVTKKLSAYCHGEIPSEESQEVAEHLIACNRCRAEFEEIKLGIKLAERLPHLSAPDSLWLDLQSHLATQSNRQKTQSRKQSSSRFRVWRPDLAGLAAGLLLIAGFAALWFYSRQSRPTWEVARLNGTPTIGSSRISEKGRLAVGQWLETDDASRAKIDVGSIGQVEIDPNTRVRLVETKPTEHRLELAQGKMSAKIWAPPRLFFVNTPSAVAADLGCAYTLEVDDKGSGLLHVTSGWVALQLKDRESMVPAGATCATRPGIGPGTPYFEDASEIFRTALAKLDFGYAVDVPDLKSPLDVVLSEARSRDSLTLWHLMGRVEESNRSRVYDRLATLVPPPEGVTRDGVLHLNEQMLQLWKDKLETSWTNESRLHKSWEGLWTRALGKVSGFAGKR